MVVQTLRHKYNRNIFAFITLDDQGEVRITGSETPLLQPIEATLEEMIGMLIKNHGVDHPIIREIRTNWALEKMVLNDPVSPEDLGRRLFNIHIHGESVTGSEIVYREADILRLLRALGLPKPVWGQAGDKKPDK